MAALLTEICIDCVDHHLVAKFWTDVLGWPLNEDQAEYSWTSATGDHTSRPMLVFIGVPESKTVKNRIHLDVSPQGCEQAEELERLLALGAKRVDVGQGDDVPWVVLADPEGNEFCLLGRRID